MDLFLKKKVVQRIDRKAAALQQTRVKINQGPRQKKDYWFCTTTANWLDLEEHTLIFPQLITAP